MCLGVLYGVHRMVLNTEKSIQVAVDSTKVYQKQIDDLKEEVKATKDKLDQVDKASKKTEEHRTKVAKKATEDKKDVEAKTDSVEIGKDLIKFGAIAPHHPFEIQPDGRFIFKPEDVKQFTLTKIEADQKTSEVTDLKELLRLQKEANAAQATLIARQEKTLQDADKALNDWKKAAEQTKKTKFFGAAKKVGIGVAVGFILKAILN